jgi:hypothetical protein
LFQFTSSGNVTTPYGLAYIPNPAFDAKMNAFAAYAGLAKPGCNPSVVTYTVKNKATGAIVATMTATYSGSGAPTFSPALGASFGLGFKWNAVNLPPDAATYVVSASGGCTGFTSPDCKPRGFEQMVGVTTFRMAPGTGTNPGDKTPF